MVEGEGGLLSQTSALPTDMNPILDSGAPTSTGDIYNAIHVSDFLGIDSELSPPRAIYDHGWGAICE